MKLAKRFFIFAFLLAFVASEEEKETKTVEYSGADLDKEIKTHANPGKQTRQDAKAVAGVMLEQVGLPFFSWPAVGILKDAAKKILSIGKPAKRPVYDEEYDYDQSNQLKSKPAKLAKVKV